MAIKAILLAILLIIAKTGPAAPGCWTACSSMCLLSSLAYPLCMGICIAACSATCFEGNGLVIKVQGDIEEKVRISELKVGDFIQSVYGPTKIVKI